MVVPAAASVQLTGNRTNLGGERRFNERMNVFVRAGLDLLGRVFRKNLFETLVDGGPFLLGEHATTQQRSRMRTAGPDVDFEKNRVDSERPVHLFENRVALLLKPTLPKFHTDSPSGATGQRRANRED